VWVAEIAGFQVRIQLFGNQFRNWHG